MGCLRKIFKLIRNERVDVRVLLFKGSWLCGPFLSKKRGRLKANCKLLDGLIFILCSEVSILCNELHSL